ncbi:MAG: bifunctional diaminohydroxyphosphoribosylaminopyrimidine deaminase/5-amino-6-(5-phosphoribosylamino)uracil reductase RibD [Bacteroidia bacterium]|nr:bifunctional diaminohydroxyphosphoribosylaminopyrimidine deaminase/5-amino-6-(5-phosphoribosylamino)uracil reductase RibD [Bacteroidia bacterium]
MSFSTQDHFFLQRCQHLASLGGTRVLPNPRVGSVIVHEGRIIGEGYHQYPGGPHAEVMAVRDIRPEDHVLVKESSLYVNLEPCSHFGKTPPCADMIITLGIPRVVIGCQDPNPKVSGAGIRRLRDAGITVVTAPDDSPYIWQNRVFFVNQQQKRPFIILKWAESRDGFIGGFDQEGNPKPLRISCEMSRLLAHKLRAEMQVIMIGKGTAAADNPHLTTRHVPGHNPIRMILDRNLRLPEAMHLRTDGIPTIILNALRQDTEGAVRYYIPRQWHDIRALLQELYEVLGICSIMVEGGSHLLRQFITQDVWDEVYRVTGTLKAGAGVPAPEVPWSFEAEEMLGEDRVEILRRVTWTPIR